MFAWVGKGAGLTEEETCDARRAISANPSEQIALSFARKVVQERANIEDVDVEAGDNSLAVRGESGVLDVYPNFIPDEACSTCDLRSPEGSEKASTNYFAFPHARHDEAAWATRSHIPYRLFFRRRPGGN